LELAPVRRPCASRSAVFAHSAAGARQEAQLARLTLKHPSQESPSASGRRRRAPSAPPEPPHHEPVTPEGLWLGAGAPRPSSPSLVPPLRPILPLSVPKLPPKFNPGPPPLQHHSP